MSSAMARFEIIRRISAGELPGATDFSRVLTRSGDGICGGCGETLSAGELQCVIDFPTTEFGPFAMHADCFFMWGEACVRTAEHKDRIRQPDEGTGASALAIPPLSSRLVEEVFCRTRLAMLDALVCRANEFAESVRSLRRSRVPATRAACETARRAARLAREAYEEHLRRHRC